MFAAPSTEVKSIPFLTRHSSNSVPDMIDWPTMWFDQATIRPSLSRPAFMACT